jgi:uncharacterized membrane protein (DUF106 family)
MKKTQQQMKKTQQQMKKVEKKGNDVPLNWYYCR